MGGDHAARPLQLFLRRHERRVNHRHLRGMDAQHAAEPHLLRAARRVRQAGLILHAGEYAIERGREPG